MEGAGGIILNKTKSRVLIVFQRKCHMWSLPKGRLIAGETLQECALREICEETGLVVTLDEKRGTISYGNRMYYYTKRVASNKYLYPIVSKEIMYVRWIKPQDIHTVSANAACKHICRILEKNNKAIGKKPSVNPPEKPAQYSPIPTKCKCSNTNFGYTKNLSLGKTECWACMDEADIMKNTFDDIVVSYTYAFINGRWTERLLMVLY